MTSGPPADADTLRALALALDGTTEAPHFDRRAFRVKRIYATLSPTARTANLCLTADDQAHWCALLPDALSPVPNKWGDRGWTEVNLAAIDPADLAVVLRRAWQIAGGGLDTAKGSARRRRKGVRSPA